MSRDVSVMVTMCMVITMHKPVMISIVISVMIHRVIPMVMYGVRMRWVMMPNMVVYMLEKHVGLDSF
jgi:hypothetical protein